MQAFYLKNELRNAILNALGYFNAGEYKLAIKYYGIASAYFEMYEDAYGDVEDTLAGAFSELASNIDTIICIA